LNICLKSKKFNARYNYFISSVGLIWMYLYFTDRMPFRCCASYRWVLIIFILIMDLWEFLCEMIISFLKNY